MGFLDTLKLDVKTWRLGARVIAVLHTVNPTDGSISPVANGALGGGTSAPAAGTGPILGPPVSAPIDGTSRALTAVPTGAGYALMQIQGSGITARFDGVAATGAAGELRYDADGFLELTTAAEITGIRYIRNGTGAGTINIVYRGN